MQIREPHSIWSYTLASIPLMVLNTLIAIKVLGLTGIYGVVTSELAPDGVSWVSNEILMVSTTTQDLSMEMPHPVVFIGILVVMIFVHEPLHLIFIPNFFSSNKTSIGFSFYGYGFVYTEEVMSKTRYILMLLSPFLLISIVLPIMLNALDLLNPLVILLILFNAMSSCVDILGLILILAQVPADGYLTLNGVRTYWKKVNSTVTEAKIFCIH